MKNQLLQIALVMLASLLLTVHTVGQQPLPAEEQIKSLRVNIQRMVENGPPTTSPDENHRKALLALRGQLLRLLLKKSGALESRIGNLESPGALPEVLAYAAQLRTDLKAVNDEINVIDQAVGGALPSSTPAPAAVPPVSAVTETPRVSLADAGERKDFDKAVASISSSDLEEAAIPNDVATTAVPLCNERGRPASVRFSIYDEAVCRLASDVATGQREIDLENDEQNLLTILTAKLLKARTGEGESYASFVSEAQDKRIDQQMGAGPTSNSATSIVSKGGIPYLLGFAVENGAATQTEKDTSITFRVNPGGLINLFADRGFITGYQASEKDPVLKFLRKTSVGLTFDTSRGDMPGIFTGRGQQLSQVSARVEFFNDRDPRQSKYAAAWERFVANEGVKLANQTWKTTTALVDWGGTGDVTFKEPALQAWLNQMNQTVKDVDPALSSVERINAIAAIINNQADKVPVALVSDTAVESLTDFARETKSYTERKDELLDTIAKGRIFTLEYTNQREVNASDTSNFNFIVATGSGRRVDLTANGSFTFFHSRPPAVSPTSPRPGRMRDFQFAGQIDIPFKFGEGQFDIWFSGRYERLMEDATLPSGVVMPDTKGDIAVGQLGLNVPIRGLGIKFPISVTFANRTELVKEKVVRGNFGFTFNWDTLLSKLKPF
jgi:hypothetical protein